MKKLLTAAAATTLLTIALGVATPSFAEDVVVPAGKALADFYSASHTGYMVNPTLPASPAPAKAKSAPSKAKDK